MGGGEGGRYSSMLAVVLTTLSLSEPSREEFLSARRLVCSVGECGLDSGGFSVDLPSLFTNARMITLSE